MQPTAQHPARRAIVNARIAAASRNPDVADRLALRVAYKAGRLAHEGALTCDDVWRLVPEMREAEQAVWNAVVDGWYDSEGAASGQLN